MFLGEYQHSMDEKNRVAIPVKFRAALKAGAVITKGLDECLFLYPKSSWKTWADKLARLPISQSRSRAFSRMMLGGAMEVQLDGQGRIVLPDYLKQYAGLGKRLIVAGLNDRVELWDTDRWQQYKTQTEKDSAHIAETLAEMGV
ncbi:MAG: division/cell wall cluster transcriptional repressor MraZ [Patescibacteria group bacterium]